MLKIIIVQSYNKIRQTRPYSPNYFVNVKGRIPRTMYNKVPQNSGTISSLWGGGGLGVKFLSFL